MRGRAGKGGRREVGESGWQTLRARERIKWMPGG